MKKQNFKALEVVEEIFQRSEKCQLDEQFFKRMENEVQFLADFCDVTPIQAVIFANALILSYDNSRFEDIFRRLGMPTHSIIRFNNEIKELFDKKLLKKEGRRMRLRPNSYDIDDEVIRKIYQNTPFHQEIEKEFGLLELLEEFEKMKDEYIGRFKYQMRQPRLLIYKKYP